MHVFMIATHPIIISMFIIMTIMMLSLHLLGDDSPKMQGLVSKNPDFIETPVSSPESCCSEKGGFPWFPYPMMLLVRSLSSDCCCTDDLLFLEPNVCPSTGTLQGTKVSLWFQQKLLILASTTPWRGEQASFQWQLNFCSFPLAHLLPLQTPLKGMM